ncbi:unnamed protein product, partial [Amoebophrya sp. A25]|eukprot:GSA25T00006531001.1
MDFAIKAWQTARFGAKKMNEFVQALAGPDHCSVVDEAVHSSVAAVLKRAGLESVKLSLQQGAKNTVEIDLIRAALEERGCTGGKKKATTTEGKPTLGAIVLILLERRFCSDSPLQSRNEEETTKAATTGDIDELEKQKLRTAAINLAQGEQKSGMDRFLGHIRMSGVFSFSRLTFVRVLMEGTSFTVKHAWKGKISLADALKLTNRIAEQAKVLQRGITGTSTVGKSV